MVSQVYYINSDKFPSIVNDYSDIRARAEKITNQSATTPKTTNIFTSLLEVTPQGRRLVDVPDKIDNGSYIPVVGAVGLTLINAKEDCRDIMGAINQLRGLPPKYNSEQYQHAFSFTRGTTIEKSINKNADAGKSWAEWIKNNDITIADTKFGKKLLKASGAEEKDIIETSIENARGEKAIATSYKGTLFGELTGKAMKRTTKLGLIVMAAIELPKVFNAMMTDGSVCDRTASTLRQTAKSTINVASFTAGIAYGGAIGAKYGGAAGSLVGMGFGAILGGKISERAQQLI